MAKLHDDATVSFALSNDLEDRVAEATGLAISTVKRKLHAANGNTLLRNLFRHDWPTRLTVAHVRDDRLYSLVAIATGYAVAEIREALEYAAGNAHVRSALAEAFHLDDEFEDDDDDDEALDADEVEAFGSMPVSDARDDDDAISFIAECTGLSKATVRRRLRDTHGRTLVQNCFADEWPEIDEDDGEDEDDDEESSSPPRGRGTRNAGSSGRGRPCPCGSGRAFADCHGRPAPAAEPARPASSQTDWDPRRGGAARGSWPFGGEPWADFGPAPGSTGSQGHAQRPHGSANSAPNRGPSEPLHPNELMLLAVQNLTWPVTAEQVNQAYRMFAGIAHPDTHAHRGETATAGAHQIMLSINDGRQRLLARLARM